MSILNNWNTKEKEPLLAKVKDKVTPQPPLRNRVETTQRAMQTLISRLDQKQSRLKTHDTALFDKVVEATQKHDKNRAAAYANELAELRTWYGKKICEDCRENMYLDSEQYETE